MASTSGGGGIFSRNSGGNVPAMRGKDTRGSKQLAFVKLTAYLGLVSFIADLRNARARELEEKRINKELANIR